MYSARVVGHNEPMTVALYQGDNAEEEWKRDLSRYSGLRHPHILQIYASASSSGIHATVFHDDLVLFSQFLGSFRSSAILQAYILWYTNADWNNVYEYYTAPDDTHHICWIRGSTGRLSVEFNTLATYDGFDRVIPGSQLSPPRSVLSLHNQHQESLVIASLDHLEWHSLCRYYLSQGRSYYISGRAEVKLRSIIYWPSGSRIKDVIEIASATEVQNEWSGWHRAMEEDDSAIRDVFGKALYLDKRISAAPWLAQANYIFSQLKINLNHEDFNLVNRVLFTLKIGKTAQNPPDGYLFLCSPKDVETGPTSFRWPDQPAYWSLNPSGSNPLSDEEAWRLGFPSITRRTRVDTVYWDETVYAGLRKFDECKGFDPESQDLAKELGHPLYELCVQTSVATSWDLPVDPEDESNYPSSYSEEEYSTEDEMESNSHLASSCVEVLTTDDENFLEEFSSDESDCSNSYPDDGVLEIELNPSSCNQELTAENEDSLRDFPSHDAVVGQHYSIGELVELVKFGLIVVLGLMTLYEYAGITNARAKPYETTSSCPSACAAALWSRFGGVRHGSPATGCRRGTGNVFTASIQACNGSFGALRQVDSWIGLDLRHADSSARASILRPRGQFPALSPFPPFWSHSLLLLSPPSLHRLYPPISYSASDSLEVPVWQSTGIQICRQLLALGFDSSATSLPTSRPLPSFSCPSSSVLSIPPPSFTHISLASCLLFKSVSLALRPFLRPPSTSHRFHVASSPCSAPSLSTPTSCPSLLPTPPRSVLTSLLLPHLYYCLVSQRILELPHPPPTPLASRRCTGRLVNLPGSLAPWSPIPTIQVTCAAIYSTFK
ncbi:hypothetical protein MSAN_01103200 [Mycena sanguinolenta]|uniref:Uncharacterized protein n=1 Tax=Mycena sanguinolenta TaxID=230812 RepID=A0A8H7D9E9_9AGAR|nr:hypothetical protein MSAN_01103200 [Mycena sanguinolenta]